MLAFAQTVVLIQPADVYFHVVSGCVHLLDLRALANGPIKSVPLVSWLVG